VKVLYAFITSRVLYTASINIGDRVIQYFVRSTTYEHRHSAIVSIRPPFLSC